MNATQEVREQYKQAARTYIEHINDKDNDRSLSKNFYEGRMSGLEVALSCLGVNGDEVREMYQSCEEDIANEREQEAMDVATASSLIFSPEFLKRRDKEQEKVGTTDQSWKQEPVPSEREVRAEQEADELADERDAEEQEAGR